MALCVNVDQLEELTPEIVSELVGEEKIEGWVLAYVDPRDVQPSDFSCLIMDGPAAKNRFFRCDALLKQLGRLGTNDDLYVLVSFEAGKVQLEYRAPHTQDMINKGVVAHHTF